MRTIKIDSSRIRPVEARTIDNQSSANNTTIEANAITLTPHKDGKSEGNKNNRIPIEDGEVGKLQ